MPFSSALLSQHGCGHPRLDVASKRGTGKEKQLRAVEDDQLPLVRKERRATKDAGRATETEPLPRRERLRGMLWLVHGEQQQMPCTLPATRSSALDVSATRLKVCVGRCREAVASGLERRQ